MSHHLWIDGVSQRFRHLLIVSKNRKPITGYIPKVSVTLGGRLTELKPELLDKSSRIWYNLIISNIV
jgi:hypothetical protein